MTLEQFISEYTKLYRFFYPTSKPNDEQMSEYYNFLKYINFNIFQKICSRIKQTEENIPRNLVAYCKNAENGIDELKGELSRGSNRPPNPQEETKCFSCMDTGFISLFISCDQETGRKRVKIYEPSDHSGVQVAKRCICPVGQKMGQSALMASQRECAESAKVHGEKIATDTQDYSRQFAGDAPF